MDQREVPGGWAAWFLVFAAAAPMAVIICLGWKVMTGSADDLSSSQGPALTGVDLLGDRWSRLWMIESVPLLPLMALLPLTLLAVLVVAGRPRAFVPTSTSRLVATFVAAVTALLGLLEGVGVACQVLGVLPGLSWGAVMGSQVEVSAPLAAMACTTTIMGIATATLLYPRGGDRHHADVSAQDVLKGVTLDDVGEGRAIGEPVHDVAVDGSTPPPSTSPPQLPVPSPNDLDLYRRS